MSGEPEPTQKTQPKRREAGPSSGRGTAPPAPVERGPGPAPREAVPDEVYEGVDFDALNRQVADYRRVTRQQGFDAALSLYAGGRTRQVGKLPAQVEP